MSINVRVHNKAGEWIMMDRPCFGFLSYIDQWDTSDIEDASHDELYSRDDGCGIEGFHSGEIDNFDYIDKPFASRSLPADRFQFLSDGLYEAMKGLPQYYGDVSISGDDYGYNNKAFNFPLTGKQMQTTVIGAMMLRNINAYTSTGLAFEEFLKEGVEPHIAFVLANAYPYSYNALNNDKSTFYRNQNGDETIFGSHARVCDLAAMIKGEIPDAWQGVWGETEEGYGRYGDYDGTNADNNPRTGYRRSLNDCVLVKENYLDSLNLTDGTIGNDDGWGTFTIPRANMFKVVIPALMEALKSGS